MRILLTNDDGLRAPGIAALYEALVDYHGEFGAPIGGSDSIVWPIAPLTVQSATSHGVTFHEPLMIREEYLSGSGPDDQTLGIAVDGRPADCVKLAITSLWPERFGAGSRPDLVISGMNAGANVGINVIYSGTVAAALEAAFLGIPSIAVSLHLGRGQPRFGVAARHARYAIERVLRAYDGRLPAQACISINVPVTSDDATPDIKVCAMNTHGLIDSYERRVSPAGDVYYWASGHGLDFRSTDAGSDVQELMKGRMTITPLWHDLTDRKAIDGLAERLARG
ncbi:MAG: 5'/3'-nucleotidase SurE [Phycisphaerales bacterium]